MNINIILKRDRSMFFEKEYYDQFEICNVDNIH